MLAGHFHATSGKKCERNRKIVRSQVRALLRIRKLMGLDGAAARFVPGIGGRQDDRVGYIAEIRISPSLSDFS
jgi:hypothetical protein